MDELKTAIKVLLANATVMYYKTHQFHWNVEGIEFTQYHIFFEDIYTDVYGSISLSDPDPKSFKQYKDLTKEDLNELSNLPDILNKGNYFEWTHKEYISNVFYKTNLSNWFFWYSMFSIPFFPICFSLWP